MGTIALNLNETLRVASDGFPENPYEVQSTACITILISSGIGVYNIKILNTDISAEDSLGFGNGILPSFDAIVYGISNQIGML